MKVLGIDSSGLVASAAIVSEEALIAEFTINNKQTHSQTLLPMIDQVVQMSNIALEEIDGIAVAAGPGSFTGLRIGSSTAKGIGLALDKPIISVPTLEGLAYRMACTDGVICPLMDARRQQVYTGIYQMDMAGKLVCITEQCAISVEEMICKVNELDQKVHFLGDGVAVYREQIVEKIAVPYDFAPIHLNRQSAASVAALGMQYLKEGKAESADEHRPYYLRKSQAEREREKKLQEQNI